MRHTLALHTAFMDQVTSITASSLASVLGGIGAMRMDGVHIVSSVPAEDVTTTALAGMADIAVGTMADLAVDITVGTMVGRADIMEVPGVTGAADLADPQPS
jgi:hypothetical protein